MTSPLPTLAVVAARFTRVLLLQRLLEQSHPHVIARLVTQLPSVVSELADFIAEHQPWLVIYDLGEPYAQSLASSRQVRALDRDLRRQYLLTMAQRAAWSPELRLAGVVAVESSVPDLVALLHDVRALRRYP